jgi:hypothetical protein
MKCIFVVPDMLNVLILLLVMYTIRWSHSFTARPFPCRSILQNRTNCRLYHYSPEDLVECFDNINFASNFAPQKFKLIQRHLLNPPATGNFRHCFLSGWVRVDPEFLKYYIFSPICCRGIIFFFNEKLIFPSTCLVKMNLIGYLVFS